MQSQLDKPFMRIDGLEEVENENTIDAVNTFFKNKLGISADIKVFDAYRVCGTYKGYHSMVVQLQNHRDKGIIFKNTKKLKDLKNDENQPYFVSDQLTAKKRAEKQRM